MCKLQLQSSSSKGACFRRRRAIVPSANPAKRGFAFERVTRWLLAGVAIPKLIWGRWPRTRCSRLQLQIYLLLPGPSNLLVICRQVPRVCPGLHALMWEVRRHAFGQSKIKWQCNKPSWFSSSVKDKLDEQISKLLVPLQNKSGELDPALSNHPLKTPAMSSHPQHSRGLQDFVLLGYSLLKPIPNGNTPPIYPFTTGYRWLMPDFQHDLKMKRDCDLMEMLWDACYRNVSRGDRKTPEARYNSLFTVLVNEMWRQIPPRK